jgi:hypothetical protein
MNILKFGRGDFFGIMIPGIFLVINIYFLFPEIIQSLLGQQAVSNIGNITTIVVPLSFIIGYIFGFALRLIKPNLLEILSFLFWCPILAVSSVYRFYTDKINNNGITLTKFFISRLKSYWEPFPYIDWFYDSYLLQSPSSLKMFFNNLLKKEFDNDREKMKKQNFINLCKIITQEKSSKLYEEVIFCEGLVRFLSGTSCALIIVIVLNLFHHFYIMTLLYIYIILFILFILKLRHIRNKEVVTIFSAFALCIKNK